MQLDALHAAMQNWARWARDDDPKLGVPPPSWAAQWSPSKGWEEGWGEQGLPDAILPPIDIRQAETLDPLLLILPVARWHTLRLHYFKARHQPEEELGAALRALGDLLERRRIVLCP